ncbi:indolepyruvate ferredoxin oxidoreductase family protein [Aestuariivirga sp.]|jgi:indolepyruvate ferredoxin oxidoreductase|uniref:indolepyruvate ferredoxin oxidoreductase family protein n=1 Tax=Aestuariivirga sp. TaxID=2650926 RepID=UPI003783BA7F
MSKSTHSLADLYDLSITRLFLTGPQAILRMVLMQSERDRQAGLNTAGYVSGYRGSPVGTVDNQFQAARHVLAPRNIVFQPGLNEDLAATALWGSQQAEMRGEGKYDGVFGLWYGKGPGVDRSGDVFRHANMAGTSPHGGVLALAGDDHSGESSTVVHASDIALMDAMIPVLSPAGVQEIIDFGLMGYALSRHAGVWVGLKCVHDTVESAAVVEAGPDRVRPVIPAGPPPPPGGLSIRPHDDRVPQEERLYMHKLPAVKAFAQANTLNRIVHDGGALPRLGLVAAGKAYLDVLQALDDLGIGKAEAERLGLRLLKVGMVWPLEPGIIQTFAEGLQTIMVVEEKRSLIEAQIRDILYADKNRPAVIGKQDEAGGTLFAPHGVLDPNLIAQAIASRLPGCVAAPAMAPPANQSDLVARIPYFCAGCPHNSSTVLPEGARGYAGIGCHWLAQFVPDRRTEGATQMGGEGANWVGEAPFSTRPHMFQNIGDGTYNHSGLMAIRHAVIAGTPITFKILYNDAVAMTGGQRNDGSLSVSQIAKEMRAVGIDRIAVVSDDLDKYAAPAGFPAGVSFHHRDALQAVQAEMMTIRGASIIIYDQTCAAEKRRRRRKRELPDPNRRVIINELVCEGCGDCGTQSNCVAIQPLETEFGRKRQIDQSTCNKDFSCIKGFCPSFVTVEGGELRKPTAGSVSDLDAVPFPVLTEPELPPLDKPWNILVAGIGGTGVVTIGHVLGMAAHIEGRGAALIDMVGISQKNGAVVTHLKIGARPADISAVRVARGHADLILGCDLVTTASARILAGASRQRSHAVVNSHEVMPAHFTHDADFDVQGEALGLRVAAAVKPGGFFAIDATEIATRLLGDAIAANLFTLGYAWQKGLIPVSRQAIAAAVELNGVAVKMNLAAFTWGRRAAAEGTALLGLVASRQSPKPQTLDEILARRVAFLTAYQDAAYARRYRDMVVRAAAVSEPFGKAVAHSLFRLMAYKDEYEVARLYTDGSFAEQLSRQFTGKYRLTFHLAPPLLSRAAEPAKRPFGSWMMTVFRLLAPLRRLRGTPLDVFGYTAERRQERQLITDYLGLIEGLLERPQQARTAVALELASLPASIRGFGHVKQQSILKARTRQAELLRLLDSGEALAAAE